MRARLGQHFLRDEGVVERIASLANALPGVVTLEIGCGPGTITKHLRSERIVAIERDARLLPFARAFMGDRPEVEFLEADIQNVELEEFARGPSSLKVVGNLPYYISHEILAMMLTARSCIASVLFVLQREVVQRMAAKVGQREGSRLSIQWARWFESDIAGIIPPECFSPKPKVHSAILVAKKRDAPLFDLADERAFERLLHCLFLHRRKTISNGFVLSGMDKTAVKKLLAEAAVPAGRRPEALTAEEWGRLAKAHLEWELAQPVHKPSSLGQGGGCSSEV